MLILIKFGGSSLTVKQKYKTINKNVLERMKKEIKLLFEKIENINIIIVHGAG